MGTIVKHAFLNVFRNKRRTTMISLLLVISFIILFLTKSYLDAMYWGLRLGFSTRNGHIQVAAKGYWDDSIEVKPLLEEGVVQKIEDILKRGDVVRIKAIEKEITFSGLIGTDKSSTVVSGVGTKVDAIGGANAGISIIEGRSIFQGDEEAIIIGKRVASKIGANVNDWVTLFSQTVGGSYNPLSYQVVGIASTGLAEADLFYSYLSLETAQRLKMTNSVDRMLIFLEDDGRLDESFQKIQNILRDLPVELKTWEQLSPFYFSLKNFYDAIFWFMMLIIVILSAVAIFELMSLAFFERFKEIGTLRAIGTTRGEVFQILFMESFFIYLFCIVIGMSAGWEIGVFLNNLNLSWNPPGTSMPVPLKFLLKGDNFIVPSLTSFVSSCLASLIPAIRATTLNVSEVLRYE